MAVSQNKIEKEIEKGGRRGVGWVLAWLVGGCHQKKNLKININGRAVGGAEAECIDRRRRRKSRTIRRNLITAYVPARRRSVQAHREEDIAR